MATATARKPVRKTTTRKPSARKTTTEPATKQDVYQMVTDKVVKALESGTVPWRKPWTGAGVPRSMSSGKPYRGINPFLLSLSAFEGGYESPFWGTYNKITDLGGQVRKGERGTFVVLWKRFLGQHKDETSGEVTLEPRFVLRYFSVFNSEQADWPEGSKEPKIPVNEASQAERDEAAEKIAAGYKDGPSVRYFGDSCHYQPGPDAVDSAPGRVVRDDQRLLRRAVPRTRSQHWTQVTARSCRYHRV